MIAILSCSVMRHSTPKDIESWLAAVQSPALGGGGREPLFLKPFHLATLALAMRRHPVRCTELPPKLRRYAHTMRLWDTLDRPAPPLFRAVRRHTASTHAPLERLRDERRIDDTTDNLLRLFKPLRLNQATMNALQTMLFELMGNCFAHAGVQDGMAGVVCAQVWPKGRRAQITLADAGVDIRASLAKNTALSSRLAAENSCELATFYGVSSKPKAGHSGYGLTVARKLLEQIGGTLYIRSGKEAFFTASNIQHYFPTAVSFDGCLLVIEWDLDRPMDVVAVYEEFPLPEGVTEDDLYM